MLKVGVLMGGMSIEREVSFNSGRTICDHLDTQLFQVIPLFQADCGKLYILPWTFLYRGKIADFQSRLETQAQQVTWDELPQLVDFVYIAVHGKYGEDGTLQAMLELLKIPYLGSKMFASALGMDKQMHNEHLNAHGIEVPKGFCLSITEIKDFSDQLIDEKLKQLNLQFPLVVKPVNEGSSFGVFVVKSRADLQQALTTACFISGSKGQAVLVEEKIVGMEFTCIIITDNETGKLVALPPTEVLISKGTDIFDYQQKYMPGAVHEKTPATCGDQLIKKIQDVCIATMQALGFTNLSRIDGFLTPDHRVVIIDSNPLSGMGPATFLFRQAAEINIGHTELINHLIKTELKSYAMHVEKNKMIDSGKRRLKVAVLFGGPSNEREISLESGRNVVYKLSPEKYEVFPIFMSKNAELFVLDNRLLVCHSTKEIEENLDQVQKIGWSGLSNLVDFVFIALHGSPGEDGTVQGALEMLQIPYNGSGVLASSLCMDKFKTTQFLQRKGFDVPQALLLSYDAWKAEDDSLDTFLNRINYPCIVKPHDDGCSVMVTSPKNRQELESSLQEIFLQKKFALIEERVTGMELTVGVLGNDNPQALIPSQTVVKGDLLSLEEKFLPGAGENQTPALLPADDIEFVRQQIRAMYQAAGCRGYARIDCFFQTAEESVTGQRRVILIEINTLPALTPATCIFHQAAELGMRPMEFIDKIIEFGLQEHEKVGIVLVDQALEFQRNLKV
ncbi:ATP-grasp domain-containing protein [Candidatus Babeliales bacterium]|nr:ATP-grasp domain-containing protein [Candidatus Babeliales bacterium]MBP9843400.1 ATP-grasp domain-containing protein [Candidatus Babeliales bacterium]